MSNERLLIALQELLDEREILKDDFLFLIEFDELTNIIAEIISTVYQSVGMRDIEKRVAYALKFDIDNLEKGLTLIKDAKPESVIIQRENLIEIRPQELIDELEDFIKKYQNNEIDRINTLFSFEISFDNKFSRILMCFNPDSAIFSKLQNLIEEKLKLLSKDELLLFWARIKSWFNHDNKNDKALTIYDDIIPQGFFLEEGNNLSIQEKCSLVIVKFIPLTIKKMLEEGVNFFPTGLPGVATILSINDVGNIQTITNIEYLLIRAASQTIAAYESSSKNKSSDLANAIGADKSSLIFTGDYFKRYQKKISAQSITNTDKNKLLISNAKRLIEYAQLYTKKSVMIETALRQYKMGQEIIAPRRNNEFDTIASLEIYLQKDMCKFLIERNIPAFGKKIGRNEIDLYHQDLSGEDFVVEAKVYKEGKNLTLTSLKDNLVQLQSYMDQHDQPRGILAIYNFTDTLLMSQKKWIRGRVQIICINLCDHSASQRKSSIEIVESAMEMISLVKINDQTQNEEY